MSGFVEALRLWTREIVLVLFLAGLLEMLLPEGDLKRFGRVAVGFFVMLAVARPVLALLGGGFAVDHTLASMSVWEFSGGAAVAGLEGALEHGARIREASRDRALAAVRASLESQIEAVAMREEGVAAAQAVVDLDTDPSSASYGAIQAVRLSVWLEPAGGAEAGAEASAGGDGAGEGAAADADRGRSPARLVEPVGPVTVKVEPVVIGGSVTAERPGVPSPAAGGGRPRSGRTAEAEELARRLRSVIVLLVGVPPGGITVEVWP
ncbi:MAG TPA: hypothetical protein DGR79_07945 [Clostridiales bacterium]|nr:hypothetical protein [Clostridiales bacterium]